MNLGKGLCDQALLTRLERIRNQTSDLASLRQTNLSPQQRNDLVIGTLTDELRIFYHALERRFANFHLYMNSWYKAESDAKRRRVSIGIRKLIERTVLEAGIFKQCLLESLGYSSHRYGSLVGFSIRQGWKIVYRVPRQDDPELLSRVQFLCAEAEKLVAGDERFVGLCKQAAAELEDIFARELTLLEIMQTASDFEVKSTPKSGRRRRSPRVARTPRPRDIERRAAWNNLTEDQRRELKATRAAERAARSPITRIEDFPWMRSGTAASASGANAS